MALSLITPDSLNLAQDYAGMGFGGTGSANQLDDYEEGTFTPTSGVTLTNNYSKYTKIGRFVYINMDIEFTTSSSGSTAAISSLPFTSGDSYSTGVISYTTSGYPDSVPNLQGSSIYIRSNNGAGNLSYANVSAKRFIISAFYVT